ncbi:hypothetical protein MBLNU457_g2480t1 [Dothideomycetes sp. NU457]
MALLINAITLPFIILFSLPLLLTAIFTTSLALSTLLIRASVVYVDLFLALLQSALHPIIPRSRTSRKPRPPPPSSASRRTTIIPPPTPLPLPVRDYESVGGWAARDEAWEAMTKRLELPAMSPSLGAAGGEEGGVG